MIVVVSCWDFERAGVWHTGLCCESCHDDFDRGIHAPLQEEPVRRPINARLLRERSYLRPPQGRILGKVCCRVANALRDLDGDANRLLWAAAARAWRREHCGELDELVITFA